MDQGILRSYLVPFQESIWAGARVACPFQARPGPIAAADPILEKYLDHFGASYSNIQLIN